MARAAWVVVCALSVLAVSVSADMAPFPLEGTAAQAFKYATASPPAQPTGYSKETYLQVIAPVVEHFRQFQNKTVGTPNYGKIVDPYTHMEMQYSTPTFAFAAATLVKNFYTDNVTHQKSLLADAELAMTAALEALAFGQPQGTQGCAQGHCNFYTMPLMLAMRTLNGTTSPATFARWEATARSIEVTKSYRGPDGVTPGNWGIVAITGEYLRYKLDLGGNLSWVHYAMAQQQSDARYTNNGEYMDRSGCGGDCSPMPYDAFPRKYIGVALAEGYTGPNSSYYSEQMRRGAQTSLLLQSPWGEVPTGGRSSQHQWNEAVQTVTFELFANYYKKLGDAQTAGIMKRAAHRSVNSLMRWKTPNGEWYILKNRFDPSLRHGYESYSFYTQYNLLPASMLSTAYAYADDSIDEHITYSEVGGFVFTLPNFHKVVANAGGMYTEVEMFADQPTHDATGLTRVHHPTVDPFATLTAGAPNQPEGASANAESLAIGVQWALNSSSPIQALATATYKDMESATPSVSLSDCTPSQCNFSVAYSLSASSEFVVKGVKEIYVVTPDDVTVTTGITSMDSQISRMGVTFPATTTDGDRQFKLVESTNLQQVCLEVPGDEVSQLGTTSSVFEFVAPLDGRSVDWTVDGNITSRNGFMQRVAATVDVTTDSPSISYRLKPSAAACV